MATTEIASSEADPTSDKTSMDGSLEAAIESAIEAVQESEAPTPVRTTSGPRILMIRKLSDIVVLPAGRISANERALTADIILQVLGKVEKELRIEVAQRVARVPECPPALTRMLLLDEPDVAAPILTGAEGVPEALIIECAREGTTAHRTMIARRIDLTTSLADVLVSFNEPEVAKILLRLDDFTLSPNAVELLVSRSVSDVEMQNLLLRRRELEPVHGFMMFWWVKGERRRRILSRYALDRSIIQEALQDLFPMVFRDKSNPDELVKNILTMTDRRHRPRGANGEAVSMEAVKRTVDYARRNPVQEVVDAVGMVAGISSELAARIIRDPGGEPYAVMCKSLGISRDDFFASLRSGDESEQMSADEADDILAVFDSMARDFSRAVLRYWDWDGNPRIARIMGLLGLDEDIL